VLALAAACAPVGPPPPPQPATDGGQRPADVDAGPGVDAGPSWPALAVGTGTVDFEALDDGDSVRFERGFQGGYHVWGALRALDIEPDEAEFSFELVADGDVIAETGFLTDLWEASDDSPRWELAGISVFVLAPDPTVYDGRSAVFRARVEDRTGVVREGEVAVVVDCCEDVLGGGPDGGPDGGIVDGNGPDGGVLPPGGGEPPVFNGFLLEPAVGDVGVALSLLALATDPDGDELSFLWQTDVGVLSSPEDDGTTWTVDTAGEHEISVTVSDGTHDVTATRTVVFE
jgi:hypothetical protein